MDPKVRHTLIGEKSKIFRRASAFLLDETKLRFARDKWNLFTRGAVVKKATQTLRKIDASAFMKFARTRVGKGGLVAAAGIIGWNLVQHAFKSINPQPVIPKNYDRGYDVLRETLTDFGSPVKLAKAANKTITPYKSAVRRGTYTTTRAVRNRNVSLTLSDNAIRHHHY